MNVREAINFGLNKLNFENIRENQRKVVEVYLSGRDVVMISPTGSGKTLTYQSIPKPPIPRAIPGHLTRVKLRAVGNLT